MGLWTLLPVQDGLGNITAVIDQATGRTVARYDYGPFGEPLAESGEVDACPFRWQTKWYDAESQHYYFGYRHYDSRFGRWLSRDPLGEAGGFNLYAYCGNDPVNRHDPLGLYEVDVHRFLTEFLAGHSGFSESMATRIGVETQALDDAGDPRDAMAGFPGWNSDNMIAYHFPTKNILASKKRSLFRRNPSDEAGDSYFTEMGEYLHSLEDSYSHCKGEDDRDWRYYDFLSTGVKNFRGSDSKDPGLGHAWEGHKPDWTWLYKAKSMKMAETVYKELKLLAETSGQKRHDPSDWKLIEPIIRKFIYDSPDTCQDTKIFGTVPVKTVTFDGYNKKIKILNPNFELDPIFKQNYPNKNVPAWWEAFGWDAN